MERLFVYGLLMRGESRHGLLRRGGARYLASGRVRGRLLDCGAYPALVAGPGHVRGELYALFNPAGVLRELDEFEGGGYRRGLVEVETCAGCVGAWAYLWAGGRGAGALIATGDWRRRQGVVVGPAGLEPATNGL